MSPESKSPVSLPPYDTSSLSETSSNNINGVHNVNLSTNKEGWGAWFGKRDSRNGKGVIGSMGGIPSTSRS